VGQGVGDWMGE